MAGLMLTGAVQLTIRLSVVSGIATTVGAGGGSSGSSTSVTVIVTPISAGPPSKPSVVPTMT